MIAKDIIANMTTDNDYKNWMDQINSEARNYESPFGVNSTVSNGQPSAQEMSNAYMLTKQRRPFVLEFYEKDGDTSPKSITMYINPERMQISNSKIIGKQHTRGGVFYHHWGSDHSSMTLTGTTGLAGMAGIKQLEEVYYASGVILKYRNYMQTQIYGNVESYRNIDYKDSVSVIENVVVNSYNSEMITDIQQKLWDEHKDDVDLSLTYNTLALLDSYKSNIDLNDFINTELPDIYSKMQDWEVDNEYTHYRNYYQKTINMINKEMPNLDDNIIVNMAYELSLSEIYSGLPEVDKKKTISEVKKDTVTSVINFQKARDAALKDHIKELKEFEKRDSTIMNALRSGMINTIDTMTDPWLPRQITLYFENIAYVGHFESFSYNRDGKTNLVSYEMRFVITKQYEFTNSSDYVIKIPDSTVTIKKVESSTTNNIIKKVDKVNKVNKDEYTVIRGDTLYSIAKRFYGNSDLWPEIYAKNINKIDNPDLIFPGQIFTIPTLPSGYKTWVVLSGDTLYDIARRFYGDSSKWGLIREANIGIIKNPNLIYTKQILKIPT